MSKLTISTERIRDRSDLVSHLILNVARDVWKAKGNDSLKLNQPFDVVLTIAGVEVDFEGFMKGITAQMNEMIDRRASSMVNEKLRGADDKMVNIVNDLMDEMKSKFSNELGVTVKDWD